MEHTRRSRTTRAFTLIDVITSMAVVAVLISLMIPGLATARETARRVVCASNARLLGIGVVLWADSHDGLVPPSVFNESREFEPPPGSQAHSLLLEPSEMTILRLPTFGDLPVYEEWDGLGLLYADEVLNTARVFYCPSHAEPNPFEAYREQWRGAPGEIVSNYHYRGEGQNGSRKLAFLEPARAALIADSLRSIDEMNHEGGVNLLRADLSAAWVSDPTGRLLRLIESSSGRAATSEFTDVWEALDEMDGSGETDRDDLVGGAD